MPGEQCTNHSERQIFFKRGAHFYCELTLQVTEIFQMQ